MATKFETEFNKEYKNLNALQKEAVDAIDGPVMVVAGPGTGKTQILALRIGNILIKTQTKADSILCLTFTNSAVKAMRERLRRYIGPEASKVKVCTFHSFGLEILEKYYPVLGLDSEPKLMDDQDTILLCDHILNHNEWEHLRPRSDASRYFRDLKSMISILKREGVNPEMFEKELANDIRSISSDPENISSRGESKGKLKKEAEKKIEGLGRTFEAMKFYALYEEEKKERNLFDYDDILESLNTIVEESEEAKSHIKENYQYVLIDEHQDSSGVQNTFLKNVWGDESKPDIFVVGDDRQLIYGFGGASLEYFDNFKSMFGKAKQITLLENYRSTETILEAAHTLLESSMTTGKLKSNHKEKHPLRLVEAYYPRDEIIAAGAEILEKIKEGMSPNDMALLVPKNKHVRSTVLVLKDMGVPVAGGEMLDLFESEEARSFIRVLKILQDPNNGAALAGSLFDVLSGISPLDAHAYIRDTNMRNFSLLNIKDERNTLFEGESAITKWLGNLKRWMASSGESLYTYMQRVGTEYLLDTAKDHEELTLRIEVLRTMLHLVLMQTEKNPRITLKEFLEFLERVESYGENIPLAIFGPNNGVKVLTMHGSKGLEFDYVWVAHMDERSFAGSRVGGFSLPESIKEKLENRDDAVLKRQLYVAITRAKRFCTISYSLKSYSGSDQELANIVADLPEIFEKQNAEETEKFIIKHDIKAYTAGVKKEDRPHVMLGELADIVARDYESRKVSVSLLNNFFECPWKWYFRNLLQLPEPKSESLEFGNIVHSSIDVILKLNKTPSASELSDIVAHQVEKANFGDETKQKELRKNAVAIISRWVSERLPAISLRRENEQSVSVSDEQFPHLSIYGKIDLIEHLDKENTRVTDFKTGGVRKRSDIENIDEEGRMSGYMRQLAMYSYLIKQSPKWKVDVRESRLEFVEAKYSKETFYNTVITLEQIEMIAKDIADYDTLVKNKTWIERPCNFNSYGKNTECDYCKLSQIYKR